MAPPATKSATRSSNAARPAITLLDLVREVAVSARSEAEIVATVRHLINSGKVTLVGAFRGADVKVA